MADVLENIAANSTHTPALYAAFLRALISAKLAPQQRLVDDRLKPDQGDDSGPTLNLYEPPSTTDVAASSAVVRHPTTSVSPSTLNDGSKLPLDHSVAPLPPPSEEPGSGYFHAQDPHTYYMNEFHFESEMGPATDITTFPPTMAAPLQPHSGGEGEGGMMAMENILSSGFWDNMVVPGTCASLIDDDDDDVHNGHII